MRPLKFWGLVVKPLPVWSMTGGFLACRVCGTFSSLLNLSSSGLPTILSIIPPARSVHPLLQLEKDDA